MSCPIIPIPSCIPKSARAQGEDGLIQWFRAAAVKDQIESTSDKFWFRKDVHRWLHLLLIANSDIARVALSLGWLPSLDFIRDNSKFILTDTPEGFIVRISPLPRYVDTPKPKLYTDIPLEENIQILEKSFTQGSMLDWDERYARVQSIQATLDRLDEQAVQLFFMEAWKRLWLTQHASLPAHYKSKDKTQEFTWQVSRLRRDLFEKTTLLVQKGSYCGFVCSDFQVLPYDQIQPVRFFCLRPRFNLVYFKILNVKLSTYFKLECK